MYALRLCALKAIGVLLLAKASSCGSNEVTEQTPLPSSETLRREHLRTSLCASFYLQERRQRLPQDPEQRRKRCGSGAYKHHGKEDDTATYGPLKTRSNFREASIWPPFSWQHLSGSILRSQNGKSCVFLFFVFLVANRNKQTHEDLVIFSI